MEKIAVPYSRESPAQPPGSSAPAIAALLSYLMLLAGLATLAALLYLVARCHARAPVWDMWSIIDFWAKPAQSTIHWLWAQHNEHRILLAKLIVLLDYRFFSGRDVFAVTASFVTAAALLAALLWAFRVLAGMRGTLWRSAAAVAAFCLFSTVQWLNFVNGFQIQFFQVDLFFTLAVLALLFAWPGKDVPPRKQWVWAAASVLAALAATYSMANGMLVWPVLVLLAILRRCCRKIVAVFALSSVAVVASYFYHYHYTSTMPQPGAVHGFHSPIQVVVYVINYIGAPLDWGHPALAIVFGLVGLAAAAFVLWRIVFRDVREPLQLLFASMLLFVIASALITALGRLHLGTEQALSARYETVTLLLWLALAVLLLQWCAHQHAWLLIVGQIGLLAVMSLAALRFHSDLAGATEREVRINTASLTLITGVFDQSRVSLLFPNPLVPWRDAAFLKQNHLSLFSRPLARQLNQPLAVAYRVRPEPCWGEITSSQSIRESLGPGLRLAGWAWDPSRRSSVQQIIFVAAGKIVGYAEPGSPQPELTSRLGWHGASKAGWVGYIGALPQPTMVTAYAVIGRPRSAEACALFNQPSNAHVPAEPVRFPASPAPE